VQGYTPTESGLLMLPLMGGIMVSSIVSGRITGKTGRYKVFPIIGTLLIAGGAFFFAQVHYDAPLWHTMTAAAIFGLGLGQCMQTLIIAVQNAGPRSDMGVSTASAQFFRQIGGTAGVAIFLTILFNTLPDNISKAFGGRLPAGAGAQLTNLQSNTSGVQSLPEGIRTPVLIGFTDSITTVFYVTAAVALLAMVVLFFMREIPLVAGGAPAASALEGGEALLDADEPTEIVEPVSLDREPALVGGRHALANGHGEVESVSGALPITASVAGLDVPVGAGGVPVTGHVRRQDGTHVAGASLTLIDQRGHQVARATGNADGSYSVPSHGPGTYVLIVAASGHQPQASSVVIGGGSATLDITLTGSGELTGTVRAADSRAPLASVTVTLTDSRGDVNGAFITTADGTYAFMGVGAGYYTLVASGAGFRPVATPLTVPDSGVLRHDVELISAVQLSGTARTDGDRPVPDARITVLDANGEVAAVARTDSEGRYVISDLPSGAFTVVASGYPPATSQVELADSEAVHDVRLGYDQAIDELVEGP
ncbi:MAG TPA: MFS transporter, partial [Amycolatopsis sp.]|nr:MFS transporter [Amycolatopsis sp.]